MYFYLKCKQSYFIDSSFFLSISISTISDPLSEANNWGGRYQYRLRAPTRCIASAPLERTGLALLRVLQSSTSVSSQRLEVSTEIFDVIVHWCVARECQGSSGHEPSQKCRSRFLGADLTEIDDSRARPTIFIGGCRRIRWDAGTKRGISKIGNKEFTVDQKINFIGISL